jgi:hypothetical protein
VIDPILRADLKGYFHRVYPLCPIVDPVSVKSRVDAGVHLYDKDFAALVLALASLALALPNDSNGSDDRSDVYIAHALEFHNTPKLGILPNLETVATSRKRWGWRNYFNCTSRRGTSRSRTTKEALH